MSDNLAYFRNGQKLAKYEARPGLLRAPAVVIIDPKYPHNVGGAVRAASCYGIETVAYSGDRVEIYLPSARIPREERMRQYSEVTLVHYDWPLSIFNEDAEPVAVEVRDRAESLFEFEHPANAVYVFGPEDGSLGRGTLAMCHRFVRIPTRHCLNLASAIATVLYDRAQKEPRA